MLDASGRQLLECEYSDIEWCGNCFLLIDDMGLCGIADPNGKTILECSYNNIQWRGQSYELEYLTADGDIVRGIANQEGKVLLDGEYSDFQWCGMGYIISRPSSDMREEYAWESEMQYGFANSEGNILLEPIYSHIQWNGSFLELMQAKENDPRMGAGYGAADIEGQIILDTMYDGLRSDGYGIIAEKDGKTAYFTLEGRKVFDFGEYDDVYRADEGYIVGEFYTTLFKGERYKAGYLNLDKEKILPLEYDSISSLHSALLVQKDGKKGIYSFAGDIIYECEYDVGTLIDDTLVLSKLGEENVSYTLEGMNIASPEEETMTSANRSIYKQYKDIIDAALQSRASSTDWRESWMYEMVLPPPDYIIRSGDCVATDDYLDMFGLAAFETEIVYYSTNEDIASVLPGGEIIANSPGIARILAIERSGEEIGVYGMWTIQVV